MSASRVMLTACLTSEVFQKALMPDRDEIIHLNEMVIRVKERYDALRLVPPVRAVLARAYNDTIIQ